MAAVTVTDFLRRTPLARALPATATWGALTDAAIVAEFAETDASETLGIADLSPLPRLGFKGRGTIPAMKARGIRAEAEPNRAFVQENGSLCLVLGASEVMLLGAIDGANDSLDALEGDWRIDDQEQTYPLPRRDSHAWFAVTGPSAPDMLAKLCAVDLRPHKFADLFIAQTSVARLSAIVTRADRGDRLIYHLLADSASSTYLLTCLLDASKEFRGALIGLKQLQSQRIGHGTRQTGECA